jgi:hypothetical protein
MEGREEGGHEAPCMNAVVKAAMMAMTVMKKKVAMKRRAVKIAAPAAMKAMKTRMGV